MLHLASKIFPRGRLCCSCVDKAREGFDSDQSPAARAHDILPKCPQKIVTFSGKGLRGTFKLSMRFTLKDKTSSLRAECEWRGGTGVRVVVWVPRVQVGRRMHDLTLAFR